MIGFDHLVTLNDAPLEMSNYAGLKLEKVTGEGGVCEFFWVR